MLKRYGALGAGSMALAVMLGAFAAHGLKERLTAEMLAVFETGVRYHIIHSLGLILLAILADRLGESTRFAWSGRLLMAGIAIFSGSLYALSITGIKSFGAITPLGGLAFIA